MSRFVFEDGDPGNEPTLLDLMTGEPLPKESPTMKAVLNVFYNEATEEERRAWHAFTCLNSREPKVMAIVASLQDRFTRAIDSLN